MSSASLAKALSALKANDINFAAFYRQTEQDWKALAAKQWTRLKHRVQGSADYDDVLQEMLMSVERSVETYDGSAGNMSLAGFVVWRAYAASQDSVSKLCGAYRRRSTEPPREPVLASCMPSRDGDDDGNSPDLIGTLAFIDADQEWAASVRERRDSICETMLDRVVMDKLVEQGACVQAIASAIYENERLREELGLDSEQRTYGLVRRTTKRFASRAADM